MTAAIPIPVTVLTGFLGSGKTTLLARRLTEPAMAGTAVVINEFGEVGLDHHLLERLEGETVLLDSGCICCSVRDGLAATLHGLLLRSQGGQLPPIKRVVIETTGLADPGPILATLIMDPRLAQAFSIGAVVTTVDGVHGLQSLDAHLESMRQIAVADRLVLTKGDLARPGELLRLRERLLRINPDAELLSVIDGDVGPDVLLPMPQPRVAVPQPAAHACDEHCGHPQHGHDYGPAPHDARVASHVFRFEQPLDWELVSHWLGSLAFFHGEQLLRVKGLLAVAGKSRPLAVHGVRHVLHEPVALRAWPDADHRSRIVFITCDLGRDAIATALERAIQDTRAEPVADINDAITTSPLAGNNSPAPGPWME